MDGGVGRQHTIIFLGEMALFSLFLQALNSPPSKNYLKKDNPIAIYLYI